MSVPLPAPSSSTTLWATASKEWVIPAKPKPGRKPKKEEPTPQEEDAETSSKGRKTQNRAAQRAFRERKQSQFAEMQARLQAYEQGEMERNVALQNIGKRLKEENEALRRENTALKEEIERLRAVNVHPKESTRRKRGREEMSPGPAQGSELPSRPKRQKANDTCSGAQRLAPATSSAHSSASPPSSLPSPNSSDETLTNSLPSSLVPLPAETGQLNLPTKSTLFEPGSSMDIVDCGFCSEDTPCMCRELAISHAETVKTSILDNLPAYQPPVPLRRKTTSKVIVTPPSPVVEKVTKPKPADCSGDPSDCPACADDPFGKAFCNALGDSLCASGPCEVCPSRLAAEAAAETPDSPATLCCGDPALCGGGACKPEEPEAPSSSSLISIISPIPAPAPSGETIPCSDAWRQLKSHPNVGFANLTILANVVARRTKCTGPRVVISPAPGSITPERSRVPSPVAPDTQLHARGHESLSPAPTLVPQDVLLRCGRKRIMEVQAEGVREALAMLDGHHRG